MFLRYARRLIKDSLEGGRGLQSVYAYACEQHTYTKSSRVQQQHTMPPTRTPRHGRGDSSESARTRRRFHPYPSPHPRAAVFLSAPQNAPVLRVRDVRDMRVLACLAVGAIAIAIAIAIVYIAIGTIAHTVIVYIKTRDIRRGA
ncbi:hypothetical protein AB1N83_007551 [Pleurotus pulmonarius]|nr:hypothetical protein EYR36_009137 [Pleurotus pulmonarius]